MALIFSTPRIKTSSKEMRSEPMPLAPRLSRTGMTAFTSKPTRALTRSAARPPREQPDLRQSERRCGNRSRSKPRRRRLHRHGRDRPNSRIQCRRHQYRLIRQHDWRHGPGGKPDLGQPTNGIFTTSAGTNVLIAGNMIGTDITGTLSVRNGYGTSITSIGGVSIGGTGAPSAARSQARVT